MEDSMYRQGDLLIILVESIPEKLTSVGREHGRVVLAHGEATGHAHAIEAEGAALFRDRDHMDAFLIVSGQPVALRHDEHDTIVIPPGQYRVVRQREYAPEIIPNTHADEIQKEYAEAAKSRTRYVSD
jgi:hypothetical protein